MTDDAALIGCVRDALKADTRVGFDDEWPITLMLSNGDLVMEGEVAEVSAKRRALLARLPRSLRAGLSSTGRMFGPGCPWRMARYATLSAMHCSRSRPCRS